MDNSKHKQVALWQNQRKHAESSRKRGLFAGIAVLIFALVLAITILPALSFATAENVNGTGGASRAGATTNTFAQDMNLQEIYLDRSIFFNNPPNAVNLLAAEDTKVSFFGPKVSIRGNKLSATGVNFFDDTWSYTYTNAAELPDGTKKDVVVTYKLDKIYTASAYSASGSIISDDSSDLFGDNNFLGLVHSSGGKQVYSSIESAGTTNVQAYKAFFTITIDIDGAQGSYILPFSGFNASKGSGGAWYPLITTNHENLSDPMDWGREEIITTGDRYAPTNSRIDFREGGQSISGGNGQNAGNDGNYNSGFAVEGTPGYSFQIGSIGGYSSGGGPQGNNAIIEFGDLEHRIESWSGTHGTIATGKSGTGTDLPGEGANHEHYKYVVPDAKRGVTYTMTPDMGYTAETITVDGTTFTVPDEINPGDTWNLASTDGNGTVTYVGGGEFTYSFDQSNTQDHTITVTWKKATARVLVSKNWNDNNNANNTRPAAMPTVTLTGSDGATYTSVSVPDADGTNPVVASAGTSYTWADLPAYNYDAEGNATDAVSYTIEESPNPAGSDYISAVYNPSEAKTGFDLLDAANTNGMRELNDPYKATVINTSTKDVAITKVWDDHANIAHLRPEATAVASNFTLYESSSKAVRVEGATPTVVDNGDDTYTVTWKKLAAFDADGNDIDYFAEETTVPNNYEITEGMGGVAENGSITNTGETVDSLKVTKTWDDADDKEGLRPNTVVVHLYKRVSEGSSTKLVQVEVERGEIATGSESTGVTWDNLLIYDESGNKISYVVTEEAVAGYTTTYSADNKASYAATTNSIELDATHGAQVIDVKNSLVPATNEVSVEKVWNDNNNAEGRRPASVDIALYEYVWDESSASYQKSAAPVATLTLDGTADASATGSEVTTQETAAWKGEFAGLPAHKGGKTVLYIVDEDVTGAAFAAAGTPGKYSNSPCISGNQIDGFKVTNTYETNLTNVAARVVWSGDNYDAPNTTTLERRPSELTVKLQQEIDGQWADVPGRTTTLTEGNNWADQFTDLPAYDDAHTKINYRVVLNGDAPSGYTASYDDPTIAPNLVGSVVLLKYNVEKLSGTKTWVDGGKTHDNASEITLVVTDEGGNVLTKDEDYHVDWQGSSYTIRGLEKTGRSYTVTEQPVTGYTSADDGNGNFTNTINQETITIDVTKTWVGENNEPVTVTLVVDDTVSSQTLSFDGNGTKSFENLPKFALNGEGDGSDDGHEIVYTIQESEGSSSYHSSIEGSATTGFTITNSFDETTIPVVKIWNDNNNQDGVRPSSVTVRLLLADGSVAVDLHGTELAPLELTEAGGWAGTFKNVPRTNDAGETIRYTLTEDSVDAYTTAISNFDSAQGFTVTNTYTPETTSVSARKLWTGEPETVGDSLRSACVLHLYGLNDGKIVFDAGTRTIPSGSNESVSWDDIPLRHYSHQDLEWKIVEESVFGYVASYEWNGNACTVTNTYTGPTTEITATKDWQDDNNRDGYRPSSVSLQLMQKIGDADATSFGDPITISGPTSSAWDAKALWSDLPAMAEVDSGETTESGDPIMEQVAVLYSVAEVTNDALDAYYEKPVVESVAPGVFKVINARTDFDTTELKVAKTWVDDDDAEGIRPDHISVTLLADGTELESRVITADNDWTTSFSNLQKNRSGEEATAIEYTVVEDEVAGYTSTISYSGGVASIVNTHGVEDALTLTVTKVWNSENGDTSNRSDVVLHLMKIVEGYGPVEVAGETKTIAADAAGDDLTVSWTNLQAVEDGKSVTYSVAEDPIEGYTSSLSDGEVSGTTITITVTNTKIPVSEPDVKPKVTYLDPKNPAGSMILSATKYDSQNAADAEAQGKSQAPSNPSHDGYTFTGWAVTQDEFGDYIIVATYNQVSPASEKVVSYVDPLAADGARLMSSTLTNNPSGVGKPGDPVHEGYTFKGWALTLDAGGNWIYTALYEKICPGTSGDTPASTPASTPTKVPPATPAELVPRTADPTSAVTVVLIVGGAVVAAAGALHRRKAV